MAHAEAGACTQVTEPLHSPLCRSRHTASSRFRAPAKRGKPLCPAPLSLFKYANCTGTRDMQASTTTSLRSGADLPHLLHIRKHWTSKRMHVQLSEFGLLLFGQEHHPPGSTVNEISTFLLLSEDGMMRCAGRYLQRCLCCQRAHL